MLRDQLSPQNPPVPVFDSHAQGFSTTYPGSSTIELSSALVESVACLSDRVCHVTLARAAAPYHAFHDDSVICLLRAAPSRRAQNWRSEEAHHVETIPSQLNCRRVSTDRLNRVGNQLVCNLLRVSPALHPPERPPPLKKKSKYIWDPAPGGVLEEGVGGGFTPPGTAAVSKHETRYCD